MVSGCEGVAWEAATSGVACLVAPMIDIGGRRGWRTAGMYSYWYLYLATMTVGADVGVLPHVLLDKQTNDTLLMQFQCTLVNSN